MARLIKWAALFHDVGKAEVPQSILGKPGKLSPHEFQIVKQHTKHGAKMLSAVPGKRGTVAQRVALLHHEWFNGQGYWGYDKIPLFVSVVSVCDVFVALCSIRPYKKAWSAVDAIKYIKNRAGTQFCPMVVSNFVLLISAKAPK
jgi:putative two-component system response regulator